MLDRMLEWLSSAVASGAAAAAENLIAMFAPHSRFFLPYFLIAVLIAGAARWMRQRSLPQDHKKPVFSDLFSRQILFHPSSLVDLKIVFANRLFTPFLDLAGRAAVVLTAHLVAVSLTGGADTASAAPGCGALIAISISVLVANDFTTYWVHRLHHEHPMLWPFHKVHHSAEVMTPLTFARKHPVYDLVRGLSNAAVVGPVQGVVFALFGVSDVVTILGVNAFYAVFHWTGSNLRHSHAWISYGPFWNRIFISPAQHQIHHSCAVRHHDRNYGEVFAVWDWMFGTLYVPQGVEDLEFGVADANGVRIANPHPTLKEAWLEPFRACGEASESERARTAAVKI